MYTRKFLLGTLFIFLFVVTGCGNIFEFLSDKDSSDAKDYAVSQNLDKGEYQEVVDDPAASPLDKAAAHLGLAGLDFTTIIEHMMEATEEGEENDLQIYFDELLPPSTLENKNHILKAINQLNPEEVGTGEWLSEIKDADVDTNFLYAIALVMNAILDYKNLVDGGGQGLLNELGDSDNSGTLDAVEAGECVLEFAAVAENDINNNLLTSGYLDTTPDTYNCQNSDVVLNIDAPIVVPLNPSAPPFTAKWIITPYIGPDPISGLSFTAIATVSGSSADPIVESDILVNYDTMEVPLVTQFDTNLKGTILSLEYALPNNPDNTVVEAMKTLWDDINAADGNTDCFTLPTGIGTDEEDSLYTSPQGSITSMEMAAYLLCNF